MWSCVQELLADKDRCTCPVARWAALQLGQWVVDHRRLLNLLQRVYVPELRIWVLLAVHMRYSRNLSKITRLSTILLHILFSSVGEVLCVGWRLFNTAGVCHHSH